MTMKKIILKTIAIISASLVLLSVPTSAFGFDGLDEKFQEDLRKGIRYFDRQIDCSIGVTIGRGESVTIIGDSITVGATAAIKQSLPEAKFYATTSKQFGGTNASNPSGIDIVKDPATELRDYVVIALGTNGSVSSSQIAEMVSALGSKRVLFVNNYHYGDIEYYAENNTGFADAASKRPTVSVIDWSSAAHANYEKYIDNSDGLGVHPTDDGKKLFATTVFDGLKSVIATVESSAGVSTITNVGGPVVVDESGPDYQTAYDSMKNNPDELPKNIFIKLKSLGLDDLHAAAIVGNWQIEGMNPKYTPTHYCDGSICGGYGLAQWGGGRTPGVSSPADGTGRDGGLYRYAISKGEPGLEASWETQVEYAWAEMTNQGPAAGYANWTLYNHETFLSKATIDDATEYFRSNYELGANPSKRQNAAQAAYKLFAGLGGSICGNNIAGNGDIVAAALKLSSGDWAGGCYLWGGGHGSYEDLMSRVESKFQPQSGKGVDCSGFVTAVVSYAAGRHVVAQTSLTSAGGDWQRILIPEPGAISLSSSHVEIITKVEHGKVVETVGSHTTGCGPGKGPSISSWPFDHGYYFKYTGGTSQNGS
jgi:hypothetical protein